MRKIKDWINDIIDSPWHVGLFILGIFGINVTILEWVQKRWKNEWITVWVAVVMFLAYGIFVVYLGTP